MMNMTRVLYVEDEASLALIVQDSLEQHGFEVVYKKNGLEALNAFKRRSQDFDAVILDIMMPIMDGFSVAEQIRKMDAKVPLLFLTSMTGTEDVVKGFKIGANDYIRKPFKIEELIVRVEALIRIHRPQSSAQPAHHEIGRYHFDVVKGILYYETEKISLSFREIELLNILMENEGEIVSREEIMNLSPTDEPYFTGRSLDVFVSRLRKHLARDESIQIMNVRGVGYKLLIN